MRSSMNISLPAPLKSWIEEQVALGGYSTASEFVRELLRREQAGAARERIDARLIEALDSGPAREMNQQRWQHIRREGIRLAKRQRRATPKAK